MKKRHLLILVIAILSPLALTSQSHATLMLTEVFLGGRADGNYFSMVESGQIPLYPGSGNRARFRFDLTGPGGNGVLLASGSVVSRVTPTRDETGFDPSMYQTPFSASLDFWISEFGNFPDDVPELPRIKVESNVTILNESVSLEDERNHRVRLHVDLASEGLLDLVADGQLLAIAIAPNFGRINNTFTLDKVRLTASAAPVPEPGTIILLGTGLLGLGIAHHRRRRR